MIPTSRFIVLKVKELFHLPHVCLSTQWKSLSIVMTDTIDFISEVSDSTVIDTYKDRIIHRVFDVSVDHATTIVINSLSFTTLKDVLSVIKIYQCISYLLVYEFCVQEISTRFGNHAIINNSLVYTHGGPCIHPTRLLRSPLVIALT